MQLEPATGTPDDAMATLRMDVDQDGIFGEGFILEQIVNFLVSEPGPPTESGIRRAGVVVNREFGFVELSVESAFGIVDEVNGLFPLVFQVAKPAGAVPLYSTMGTILDEMARAGWKGAVAISGCALGESHAVTHCGCFPLHRSTVEN
jgi:hypothetical protein